MQAVSIKGGARGWKIAASKPYKAATLQYAKDFHSAALKAGSILVRCYLLGHALELYMKLFLLNAGARVSDLHVEYGHNLSKLLRECEAQGLSGHTHVSTALRLDLQSFNRFYQTKALEYFSPLAFLGPPRLKNANRLFRFATSLRVLLGEAA
jgi:hypothetical protein